MAADCGRPARSRRVQVVLYNVLQAFYESINLLLRCAGGWCALPAVLCGGSCVAAVGHLPRCGRRRGRAPAALWPLPPLPPFCPLRHHLPDCAVAMYCPVRCCINAAAKMTVLENLDTPTY